MSFYKQRVFGKTKEISPQGNISKAWNDIGDIQDLSDCDMDITKFYLR